MQSILQPKGRTKVQPTAPWVYKHEHDPTYDEDPVSVPELTGKLTFSEGTYVDEGWEEGYDFNPS